MIEFLADVASNHDGSLDRALKLIHLAANAGATVVKAQHFRAAHIVSPEGFAAMPKLAHQAAWADDVFTVYERASIPWDWTPHLAAECERCAVEFMSTPYDLAAVEHLNPYVKRWKIGSGDITYRALLEAVAKTGKPVILSTGASEGNEIREAIAVLGGKEKVKVLECTTDYTGGGTTNVRVIGELRDWFDGLSDHTPGHVAACAAVALGATIIEKHFTDDRRRPGPDHGFAMEPADWQQMVEACEQTLACLGDGIKKVELCEQEARIVQRRCWRATRDLPAGTVLTSADLVALRPCPDGAVNPMTSVSGSTLTRSLRRGEALMQWDHAALYP